MTNQGKIYGAVLALAASAFGVDRLWLGPDPRGGAGPQSAAQAPAPPALPAERSRAGTRGGRGGGKEAPTAATSPPTRQKPLSARLLEVARAENLTADPGDGTVAVADAFKPSALWYPAPAAAPVAAQARPAVPPERLEEFRTHHRLTAVMRSARGGLALIGGKVYAPGQTIDGFTLDSVGERSAILRNGDATVELKIDPPGALSSLSGG